MKFIYPGYTNPTKPEINYEAIHLSGRINGLLERDTLKEQLAQEEIQFADSEVIKSYVSDLRKLLGQGSIVEQRAFIKTFVNRVEYDHPNITVEYTIPFDTNKAEPPDEGVLSVTRNSSPNNVVGRTFKLRFSLPVKRRSIFVTSAKQYRNPIILAKELKGRLDAGEFSSKSTFGTLRGVFSRKGYSNI